MCMFLNLSMAQPPPAWSLCRMQSPWLTRQSCCARYRPNPSLCLTLSSTVSSESRTSTPAMVCSMSEKTRRSGTQRRMVCSWVGILPKDSVAPVLTIRAMLFSRRGICAQRGSLAGIMGRSVREKSAKADAASSCASGECWGSPFGDASSSAGGCWGRSFGAAPSWASAGSSGSSLSAAGGSLETGGFASGSGE